MSMMANSLLNFSCLNDWTCVTPSQYCSKRYGLHGCLLVCTCAFYLRPSMNTGISSRKGLNCWETMFGMRNMDLITELMWPAPGPQSQATSDPELNLCTKLSWSQAAHEHASKDTYLLSLNGI